MTDLDPIGEPMATQLPFGICDLPGGLRETCAFVDNTASGAANSAFDDLVSKFGNSMAALLRQVMTWWIKTPSPQLTSSDGGPGPILAGIRDYTSGLQVLLLTGGLLFAAARLALAKRGGTAGEAQETFLMLGRAVFAAMTFGVVITAGTRAGEQFSEWVIFDASRGDLDGAVTHLVEFDLTHNSNLGTGTWLVLFILGIISMLVQLVMMVIRQALLILVVAVLPIAAAASGTGPGSQAFKRLLSWSLAFLLWKPVGALVYAIAFTVAGRDQQDPQLMLLGLILLVMTVVVLPALMRLVTPAVATLGGGGGAGAALAGGLAGVAMSTAGSGGGSQARKVAEGENSPGASGAAAAPPAPTGGDGGGGGGRAMPDGSGGDSGGPRPGRGPGPGPGPAGPGPSGSGGTATPTSRDAHAGTATPTGAAGGQDAAGAGAAGPIRAAVTAAAQTTSAAENTIRDATASGGPDPDALGPGEVRR